MRRSSVAYMNIVHIFSGDSLYSLVKNPLFEEGQARLLSTICEFSTKAVFSYYESLECRIQIFASGLVGPDMMPEDWVKVLRQNKETIIERLFNDFISTLQYYMCTRETTTKEIV